jgi:hypothetical protein
MYMAIIDRFSMSWKKNGLSVGGICCHIVPFDTYKPLVLLTSALVPIGLTELGNDNSVSSEKDGPRYNGMVSNSCVPVIPMGPVYPVQPVSPVDPVGPVSPV